MNRPGYHWVAVYRDGRRFPQFNENGSENRYADINRRDIAAFEFWKDELVTRAVEEQSSTAVNPTPITEVRSRLLVALDLQHDSGLVFFYRRRVGKGAQEGQVVYLVGWQKHVAGQNVQAVLAVPNWTDTVLLIDGWREGTEWAYPIVGLEFERVPA